MKKNSSAIYAFIDSQNLNLSVQSLGWKLDWKRFRIYLEEQYGVKKCYLFLGYIPQNKNLYMFLQKQEYHLIFKPILLDQRRIIKGNCDAELVLHTMIQYPFFDKAIVVSGDGDFYCLFEYLKRNEKLFHIGIPNKYKFSALLRPFRHFFFYMSELKEKLEYKKGRE